MEKNEEVEEKKRMLEQKKRAVRHTLFALSFASRVCVNGRRSQTESECLQLMCTFENAPKWKIQQQCESSSSSRHAVRDAKTSTKEIFHATFNAKKLRVRVSKPIMFVVFLLVLLSISTVVVVFYSFWFSLSPVAFEPAFQNETTERCLYINYFVVRLLSTWEFAYLKKAARKFESDKKEFKKRCKSQCNANNHTIPK